jgi:gas vesicle protein
MAGMLDDQNLNGEEVPTDRSFAAGLLIGVVFGAGIALLLAPERGSRTRRELKRRLRRRRPTLRERLERAAERARDRLS